MRERVFSRLGLVLVVAVLVGAVSVGIGNAAPSGKGTEVENFMPVLTPESLGPPPKTGRLMVVTSGPVTDAMLEALGQYGKVHGVIHRYNLVAITPHGERGRRAIERLLFVTFVEEDQPRSLTDVGTWDRDIIDAVDVEESGSIGDPDFREVFETGDGVHVAVIDTGLIKRWRNFLDGGRVATHLARAFMGGGAFSSNFVHTSAPTNLWERDTNSHGTSVASHIIGFKIGPFVVDGVAPGATIIPLKVFPNGEAFTFASRIIAAIVYATQLKVSGVIGPTVINMSLSGGAPSFLERIAIQDAIANGVIVVASAGNAGENGMGWPGAFPEVISVGAVGWTQQFQPSSAFWWTQDVGNDPDGAGTSEEQQAFVTLFSSRAVPARSAPFGVAPQELDVLAPGLWTVAPCIAPFLRIGAGKPGFCFWAGTSFSSPLTAGVAALILDKNSSLVQADVENILKTTALPMAAIDSRPVGVPIGTTDPTSWDTSCGIFGPCDPVGAGLLQADAALAATP